MTRLLSLAVVAIALACTLAVPSPAEEPQAAALRPILAGGDSYNILALPTNGTCLSLDEKIAPVVKEWKDLIAVDAGYYHVIGLKRDGTCVSTINVPGMKEGAKYA